jgi:hypothetical protein
VLEVRLCDRAGPREAEPRHLLNPPLVVVEVQSLSFIHHTMKINIEAYVLILSTTSDSLHKSYIVYLPFMREVVLSSSISPMLILESNQVVKT